MNLKKIITLTAVMFIITFSGFSQVEQEEAPMFGTTRNFALNPSLLHDFGQISGTVQTYQFKIKNTGKTDLNIVNVLLPEKFSLTLSSKVIKPNEEGFITVSIDPTIAGIGKISQKFVVFTEQSEPGIVTKKEISYKVYGEVK